MNSVIAEKYQVILEGILAQIELETGDSYRIDVKKLGSDSDSDLIIGAFEKETESVSI